MKNQTETKPEPLKPEELITVAMHSAAHSGGVVSGSVWLIDDNRHRQYYIGQVRHCVHEQFGVGSSVCFIKPKSWDDFGFWRAPADGVVGILGGIPGQSLKSHMSLALINRCIGATGCFLDCLTKRVDERIS